MNTDRNDVSRIETIADEKIAWLKSRADSCMVLFWIFTVVLGISSTSLPFFAFLDRDLGASWIVPLLSVIVAFCSFMLQIGSYNMLWKNYRNAEFGLRRIRNQIVHQLEMCSEQSSEEYKDLIFRFYDLFEEIETLETNTYFSTLKPVKDASVSDAHIT